jgi:general secretion pathway protein D
VVENKIPEIQVREMESVLRVADGSTAVLGGLMQDSSSKNRSGLPGLGEAEGFGFLFNQNEESFNKTELVIFLRPRIIRQGNIDTDLLDFKRYLTPAAFTQ